MATSAVGRSYTTHWDTTRESGCAVPSTAYVDTFDPEPIEIWFLDNAERRHRLTAAVQDLAALPLEPERD